MPRPSSSKAWGMVPAFFTSSVTAAVGTLAGASWTFHSERATLTVLGAGFPPTPPYGEAKPGAARTAQSRTSEPVRPRGLRARDCETVFIRCLQVSDGELRSASPDLVKRRVIPGAKSPRGPGINGAAGESRRVEHRT